MCSDADVKQEANFEHINLETIFRQRDKAFIDILQKLRLGIPLLESERKLLCEEKPSIDNAVKLYPRRDDVKRINDAEFKKLRTTPRVYHCADHFKQQPHHHELSFYNNRAADGTLTKLVRRPLPAFHRILMLLGGTSIRTASRAQRGHARSFTSQHQHT